MKTALQMQSFDSKAKALGLEWNKANQAKKISEFELRQKFCLNCRKRIPYSKRRNDYCGHSCAVSVANRGRCRHGNAKVMLPCKNCGDQIASKRQLCSQKCYSGFVWSRNIEYIENTGLIPGGVETSKVKFARRYLKRIFGWKCSICGTEEWMGEIIYLILYNINGNSEDWSVQNVRLVCGNCDMQLPTYKGRNKGKGREWRRILEAKKKANIRNIALGLLA